MSNVLPFVCNVNGSVFRIRPHMVQGLQDYLRLGIPRK